MKKNILILIHFFIALTAIGGGIALVTTNGMGMYASTVQPLFYNYTIPGYILGVVVGGSNLLAALGLIRKNKFQNEFSAAAGFGLLIWILIELYITNLSHFLQLVYFSFGIIILILIMLRLKQRE